MPIFYGKSLDMQFVPDNKKSWLEYLIKLNKKKLVVNIDQEKGKRTGKQNDALHLFFENMAHELNERGLTLQKVLEKRVEINWNKDLFKEAMWRPLQIAVTGKVSTTDLDNIQDIDNTYEHLNRFMGEKFGIHVPFPDKSLLPKQTIDYPIQDETNTPTI